MTGSVLLTILSGAVVFTPCVLAIACPSCGRSHRPLRTPVLALWAALPCAGALVPCLPSASITREKKLWSNQNFKLSISIFSFYYDFNVLFFIYIFNI